MLCEEAISEIMSSTPPIPSSALQMVKILAATSLHQVLSQSLPEPSLNVPALPPVPFSSLVR